ncbi:glycosyltransferase family 2 protein [Tomitella gaofuii]|uniref:glycosyltransferase family 2 protein n=1 Tax=Tomitella gaofuii TaxID=2760083 RepID=UPI001C716B9D|nr:glycosyltransferase family 2 protein [Tomitella gaofuii]
MRRRLGKGYALLAGFKACTSDIIVMMDADGSMTPSEIRAFVSALEAGADLVKGSRFLQGGGSADLTPVRMLGNSMLTYLVRASFGGRYSDLCYGYMAFWRELLPLFDADVAGFEVETFLSVRALTAGLRVVEVASYEGQRISGESNLRTMRDGFRVLGAIARERVRVQRYRKSTGPGHPEIVVHVPRPGEAALVPATRAAAPPMAVGAAVAAVADGAR